MDEYIRSNIRGFSIEYDGSLIVELDNGEWNYPPFKINNDSDLNHFDFLIGKTYVKGDRRGRIIM